MSEHSRFYTRSLLNTKPSLPDQQPDVIAATPGIYHHVVSPQNTVIPISFVRRLPPEFGPLMFLATATVENKAEECLVKLVYGRYGTEVHDELAKILLAPRLFGTLAIPGAPIAIAMEHLQPPSPGKEGWVTLFSLGKNIESDAQRGLALAVHEIVQKLEQANLVHGDLRLNNLMVHVNGDGKILLVDGKARIKVIDFDWSGKSC